MAFEHKEPPAGSTTQQPPVPAQQSSAVKNEDTQPRVAVQPASRDADIIAEPTYSEHVSFAPSARAVEGPNFYPQNEFYPQEQARQAGLGAAPSSVQPGHAGQPPVQGQAGQPPVQGQPAHAGQLPVQGQPAHAGQQQPGYSPYGYNYAGYAPPQVPYPGYPGHYGANAQPYYPYGYPPYMWPPARPKRDGYLLGMAITSFICSILVVLGGLVSGLLLFITALSASNLNNLPANQVFSSIVLFTSLTIAGLVGGGFGLYHSIRSLFLKKPSAAFKLPQFWIFLAIYVVLVILGFVISANSGDPGIVPSIVLIALAGILPALTFLSLGLRRLRYPRNAVWPTTWRRFTLCIVSGATSAIVLALIFEWILSALAVLSFGSGLSGIDNPNLPTPHSPGAIALLLVIVSVIAPLVEESVKPLAAIILIGRVRSAAEAFILGMACGVGFDMIETSGYIGMGGQHDWIYTALERSTAGLLHGFGAGMVALGWYYFTHKKSVDNRVLIAIGCCVYAVLQHAIWNGSFVLQLLPAPIGPFLEHGVITLGSIQLPSFLIVEVLLSALMLCFFLYVTGKIRRQPPAEQHSAARAPQYQYPAPAQYQPQAQYQPPIAQQR